MARIIAPIMKAHNKGGIFLATSSIKVENTNTEAAEMPREIPSKNPALLF